MIEAIGSKVLKLVRTGIGPIEIAGLPIGTWRPLTESEIQLLSGSPGRKKHPRR
jgi:16S rRNA U516 pseudouridylate synthase RsuA-like enzyme